jgi:hypothetical protein
MTTIPEPQPLADALEPYLDGRRVRAAVFLTYTFEPDFFELFVLPALLPNVQLSPSNATALWQLEDALRGSIGDVAVYYDRRGLTAREGSARLDVRRIPCAVPNGFFHPKVLLALTEPAEEGEDDVDRLVVLVSSANLTQNGWWTNVEVAHIESADDRSICSFRDDLLELIRRVKRAAIQETQHTALDKIDGFVQRLSTPARKSEDGILHPRLYVGQEPLADWLKQFKPRSSHELSFEVISPFFDETEAKPLNDVIASLRPWETRVFLPLTPDGAAACVDEYYQVVASIDGCAWAQLPRNLLSYGKGERFKQRTVHAKVYRMFDRRSKFDVVLAGSVNLTGAAHSGRNNVEAAFLISSDRSRRPDWWLTPLDRPATTFIGEAADEEAPQPPVRLAARYDWLHNKGEVFWDDVSASDIVDVTAHGATLFTLTQLPPRTWIAVEEAHSNSLQNALQSSSFLLIREQSGEYTILVDETGMPCKPSVRRELTIADILKSWSLLTPEQRSAFLEELGGRLVESLREQGLDLPPLVSDTESFFDRHAGIFLAFGNLERRIVAAVEEDRDKEIQYWLLGRQYDSLLTLLERAASAAGDGDSEPVHEYLMLLCTRQLVQSLTQRYPALKKKYPDGFVALDAALERLNDVRSRFSFDTPENRDRFLEWFESWFLHRAKPVAAH